jgi:hypothetical protein
MDFFILLLILAWLFGWVAFQSALIGALMPALLVAYYLPWIVSKYRKHPQHFAIFVANTLRGWTFIFGAFAFVWAASGEKE